MNKTFLTVIKSMIFIVIGWGSVNTLAFSQEQKSKAHDGHEVGGMEVGLSVGYVYLKEDKKSGINFHLHVMKRLSGEGLQKYLSIGLGAETIISKEKHYSAMVTLGVHPWKNLVLSVSPGMEWAEHDGKWESEYATHFEATYVFEGSNFHYGPVVGYSKARDEQHYTIGVHFGMPF